MRLQDSFITTARQFEEGTVEVFEQPVNTANVQRAVLRITALGLYVAYLNGKRVGDVFLEEYDAATDPLSGTAAGCDRAL